MSKKWQCHTLDGNIILCRSVGSKRHRALSRETSPLATFEICWQITPIYHFISYSLVAETHRHDNSVEVDAKNLLRRFFYFGSSQLSAAPCALVRPRSRAVKRCIADCLQLGRVKSFEYLRAGYSTERRLSALATREEARHGLVRAESARASD